VNSDVSRVGPLHVAGASVYIETSQPGFADVARWSFGDLVVATGICDADVHVIRVEPNPRIDGRWAIWLDGRLLGDEFAEGYVLFHVQWELNRLVLDRTVVTVHAAAAAIGGRAVVLPGESMSGKTTLAGFMAATGDGYAADEVVAIADDGRMVPFPRPLGLRPDTPLMAFFHHPDTFDRRFDAYEMLVPVSAMRATIVREPIPIAAVVFPRYERGAASELTPIPRAVALDRLCSSSPGLARHGGAVFRALAARIGEAWVGELVVDNLGEAARLVRSQVAGQRSR
jgi:hypothetical protein